MSVEYQRRPAEAGGTTSDGEASPGTEENDYEPVVCPAADKPAVKETSADLRRRETAEETT